MSTGEEEPTHLIFLGNPGSGKSTLLNGIAQEVIFNAGLAEDGGGLTQDGEVVEAPLPLQGPDGKQYILCDTPGLMDAKRKKTCVDLVNRALGQGRNSKIVFVVTWRVLDEDATAIHAMLAAINADMEDKFGVIFNQVPRSEFEKIEHGTSDKVVGKLTLLLATTYKTKHITFLESLDELEEAENQIPPEWLVAKYLRFLGQIPSIRMVAENFKPITVESLEALADAGLKEALQKVKQENSDLKQQMDDINSRKVKEAMEQAQKPQPEISFSPNPLYTQPLQRTPVHSNIGSTSVISYQYVPVTYRTAPVVSAPVTTTYYTYPATTYYTYHPRVTPTCVQQ